MRRLLHAAMPRQAGSSQHLVQHPPAMPGLCGVKNEFTAKLGANSPGHACYLSAMPQTRTLLRRTDTLVVERVVSNATAAQWSPPFKLQGRARWQGYWGW